MCVIFQEQGNSVQCSYCPTAKPATLSTAFSNSPLILVPLAADNGNNITYDNELLMLLLDNRNVSCLVYKRGDSGPWDKSMTSPHPKPLATLSSNGLPTLRPRSQHTPNARLGPSQQDPPTGCSFFLRCACKLPDRGHDGRCQPHSQPLARIDRAMGRGPAAFILEPERDLVFEQPRRQHSCHSCEEQSSSLRDNSGQGRYYRVRMVFE
jgi:hypothetical protein